MNANQPRALYLADVLCSGFECDLEWYELEAARELRRLHAENETLRAGYDAARLEIESLRATLGQQQGKQNPVAEIRDGTLHWHIPNPSQSLPLELLRGTHPLYTSPQPKVEQGPVRWPENASEVRAFLSGHVASERYARDDHQPDDDDTYTLSAHDLLGAIYWWTDFDPQPKREPLSADEIHALCRGAADDPHDWPEPWAFKAGVVAAEIHHGIRSNE